MLTARLKGRRMQGAKFELLVTEAPDAAEIARCERQTLLELIEAHERGLSRLPDASVLRGSLERALPYLRLAVGPPPELRSQEPHQQQMSLLLRSV